MKKILTAGLTIVAIPALLCLVLDFDPFSLESLRGSNLHYILLTVFMTLRFLLLCLRMVMVTRKKWWDS